MTLLKQLNRAYDYDLQFVLYEHEWAEVKRAMAIAQAVDETSRLPRVNEIDAIGAGMVSAIKERAEEILKGLK